MKKTAALSMALLALFSLTRAGNVVRPISMRQEYASQKAADDNFHLDSTLDFTGAKPVNAAPLQPTAQIHRGLQGATEARASEHGRSSNPVSMDGEREEGQGDWQGALWGLLRVVLEYLLSIIPADLSGALWGLLRLVLEYLLSIIPADLLGAVIAYLVSFFAVAGVAAGVAAYARKRNAGPDVAPEGAGDVVTDGSVEIVTREPASTSIV